MTSISDIDEARRLELIEQQEQDVLRSALAVSKWEEKIQRQRYDEESQLKQALHISLKEAGLLTEKTSLQDGVSIVDNEPDNEIGKCRCDEKRIVRSASDGLAPIPGTASRMPNGTRTRRRREPQQKGSSAKNNSQKT